MGRWLIEQLSHCYKTNVLKSCIHLFLLVIQLYMLDLLTYAKTGLKDQVSPGFKQFDS